MPLYDLKYQRFDGPRTARLHRSWALTRSAANLLLKQRRFLLILAISWIPVIVRGVILYLALRFPQVFELLEITPLFWQEFLSQQVLFLIVLLVSLFTGAGAIANDLRSGALVTYLSKPISRFDYVMGKALPVLGAIAAVTLAPAFLLLLLHMSVAGNSQILQEAPWLPFAIIAYSLWLAAYFGLIVLAVSSLSPSGRIAGAGFAVLALGSFSLYRVAATLPLGARPVYISMMDVVIDGGHVFFMNSGSGETPYVSLVVTALAMAASASILRTRLRSVEVSS